jgi:hypothetical protein
VRTEGIQEALLKIPPAPENADRITKMRRVIKAVSIKNHYITHLSHIASIPVAF